MGRTTRSAPPPALSLGLSLAARARACPYMNRDHRSRARASPLRPSTRARASRLETWHGNTTCMKLTTHCHAWRARSAAASTRAAPPRSSTQRAARSLLACSLSRVPAPRAVWAASAARCCACARRAASPCACLRAKGRARARQRTAPAAERALVALPTRHTRPPRPSSSSAPGGRWCSRTAAHGVAAASADAGAYAHALLAVSAHTRLFIHADGNGVRLAHKEVHKVAVVPARRAAGASDARASGMRPAAASALCTLRQRTA